MLFKRCEKGGNVIMTKDNLKYSAYIKILEEELVPAMGCTEPIALAYCAAKATAYASGVRLLA